MCVKRVCVTDNIGFRWVSLMMMVMMMMKEIVVVVVEKKWMGVYDIGYED